MPSCGMPICNRSWTIRIPAAPLSAGWRRPVLDFAIAPAVALIP
jgi:hypothetical protein